MLRSHALARGIDAVDPTRERSLGALEDLVVELTRIPGLHLAHSSASVR